MSTRQKDGGQAFPSPGVGLNGHQRYAYEGMSLRDYFAAKAMHASMVTPEDVAIHAESGDDWVGSLACMAYRVADAMLKARTA